MTADPAATVLAHWHPLCDRLGIPPVLASSLAAELQQCYGAPGRHYHALAHIAAMLEDMRPLAGAFACSDCAMLAIMFHDAVYDPAAKDNEDRSAALMRSLLADHVAADALARAAAAIVATRHHVSAGDRDSDLVIDLDMAVLGAPWPDYLAYAQGVMREYVPVYGESAYRQGRAMLFLAPTLARSEIFLTAPFRPRDGQARANLSRELDMLQSGKELLP